MEKLKLLVKGILNNLFFSAILFFSAGKINFLQAWLFLGTNILASVLNVISIRDIEIIKERASIKKDAKAWDKKILGISALVYLITIVVAGLDAGRFNWSPRFHWSVFVAGFLLLLVGQLIFITARNQNNFFSAIVRIQTESGHTVCDIGLYRIVRHPGYAGMITSLIGIPFLVGSVWSLIPTLVAVILLVVRTKLEDKTLIYELDGYAEYAQKTKFKLIPFVW